MQSLFIILLLFLCASLPLNSIINLLLNPSDIKPSGNSNTIHFPSNIFKFLFIQSLNFLLGFGLFYISEKLLYFQPDIFILTSFSLILIGYFWSFLNSFNPPQSSFFFIFGVYIFFSSTFLWLVPVLFLIFSLLFNSLHFGYLIMIIVSFSGLILFETNYLFLGFNCIFLTIYCIRFYTYLIRTSANNNTSLIQLFNQRS
jgi:hypothetical protein